MLRIVKVLNSSVVLVSDGTQKEFIVLQKGVGYGRKPGEQVELSGDGRIYMMLSSTDHRQLAELLSAIPPVYLEITQEIVDYAEQTLSAKLNEHIYLALTDHLYFAVERQKQGLVITNRVFWELKTFYPTEYQIGLFALDVLEKRLGFRLSDEEAANVAFHVVNAQKDEGSQYDAMRAAKFIGNIVTLVTYTINWNPDKESIHYSRFISHMQFFAERFFTDRMLEADDDFLYQQVEQGYPQAMSCAEKIRTFIVKEYDRGITNEEVVYLAIHIQRLLTR